MKLPVLAALIRGPSMAPTLRDGDVVLARRGGRRPRAGDVVLARFRARTDLLVVKRVVRAEGTDWWLEGDNPYATDDSRTYGPAIVEARVILRWWPRPRFL
jgi:phage repressor protein C with HTH and peptisase S24 domain